MTEFHKIWIDQCAATQMIQKNFGVQQALNYLVGQKFLDFIDTANTNQDFQSEIPAFATKIRSIFEPSDVADFLATMATALGDPVAETALLDSHSQNTNSREIAAQAMRETQIDDSETQKNAARSKGLRLIAQAKTFLS